MKTIPVVLAVLAIFGVSRTSAQGASWGYGTDDGPPVWGTTLNYTLCSQGMSQSPINIITADTMINYNLLPFERSSFSSIPGRMKIRNNGHTIQVDLTNGYNLSGILPADYQVAQFHFHWSRPGQNNGSEHTLNGQAFFGEMHIVHYNTRYSNLSAAASQPDGLAVLGFFIQDDYEQDNLAFDRLLNLISNQSVAFEDGEFVYDELFTIETLLPPNLDSYYRYQGSLTTPPCFESVTWTVFDSMIRISKRQASILETMVYETKNDPSSLQMLHGNFRPPQPLNTRTVYRSPPCNRNNPMLTSTTVSSTTTDGSTTGSSSALRPTFFILSFLAMILSILLCY